MQNLILENCDFYFPLNWQFRIELIKIPVEAFKNFDEEQAVNIIANTFQDDAVAYDEQYKCTINPIDKSIQLHEEKILLYERMLKEKDDVMTRLES